MFQTTTLKLIKRLRQRNTTSIYLHLGLDPNEEDKKNEENLTPRVDFPEAENVGSLKYSFEDFVMFDIRCEEDNTFKRTKRKRIC